MMGFSLQIARSIARIACLRCNDAVEPLTGAQRRGAALSFALDRLVFIGQLPGIAQFGRSAIPGIPTLIRRALLS